MTVQVEINPFHDIRLSGTTVRARMSTFRACETITVHLEPSTHPAWPRRKNVKNNPYCRVFTPCQTDASTPQNGQLLLSEPLYHD